MSEENNFEPASGVDFLKDLCMTEMYSDVTIIMHDEKIPAHRNILASQSKYFYNIFMPTVSKPNMVFNLQEDVAIFKQILKLAYGDKDLISELPPDKVFETLHLANDYGFKEVIKTSLDLLSKLITFENVISILNLSVLNQLTDIVEKCYNFLDENAGKFVANENFVKLSESSLIGLLQRDTFSIDEIKIFTAAAKWYAQNPTSDKQKIIKSIRFPLMNISDLVNLDPVILAPEANQIVEAIKIKTSSQINLRKRVAENQTIHQSKKRFLKEFGAKIIQGRRQQMYFDNNWHELIEFNKDDIVIEFDTARLINHIEFKLKNETGYLINISLDGNDWKIIIDYSKYLCRNDQNLYFQTEKVKFVKIHKITSSNTFINDFFAQLSDFMPSLENDIIVPTKDMIRNITVAGKYQPMVTEFVLSPKFYLILFNQPYLMSSLSLICHGTYKFAIECIDNSKILINDTYKHINGFCAFKFESTVVTGMKAFNRTDETIKTGSLKFSNLEIPAIQISESKPSVDTSEFNPTIPIG